ncbi:uncharacterized protein BJ212DRAFT_1300643 [Suillus subaureus]|uniref:Uncharacterized protein n=1 Tax=Suillus subaureus TaxID=48587 RepID=A0A9P7E922_9AGAM|nr:uncharacterized protein BJ212DRAFT_1300643 [Suillus subaureus]KAG1814331.1 hypothetical protein BJ212DRAFT_1300643 [Suillus subaureus]
MLPQAVQDFLNIPSDPDLDGYQGDISFDDTGNGDTRSSSPVMTPSDDFILELFNPLNPLGSSLLNRNFFTTLVQHKLVKAHETEAGSRSDTGSIMEPESEPEPIITVSTVPHPKYNPGSTTEPESDVPPPKYNPGSTTEPESEPEPIAIEPHTPVAPQKVLPILPPNYEPGSTTESESEMDAPNAAPPPANNPSSVTESESKPDAPSTTMTLQNTSVMTLVIKRKSFFSTPSPPGPDSIYWKYVSREEDAKWYDHLGTDNSFCTVRQMKEELQELCDQYISSTVGAKKDVNM